MGDFPTAGLREAARGCSQHEYMMHCWLKVALWAAISLFLQRGYGVLIYISDTASVWRGKGVHEGRQQNCSSTRSHLSVATIRCIEVQSEENG